MNSQPTTDREDLSPDVGFVAIVFLVIAISTWLLLMPAVPAIAQTTINRFHFRTASFSQWAIQQPIPAMYNLANRFQVTQRSADGSDQVLASGMVNHFPARKITFANGRYRNLKTRCACDLQVTSSYRGLQQRTQFHIEPQSDGGFVMSRSPVDEVQE
ncbi:hypothetical protein [Planctomycetes bacterium K23_9]|uniref:Uncharacterized protein n=1 Tax=Stieleria marina TaxID=1930275 RepID=A0A517NVG6_9BACT|nr:hypothetical protein K239x_31110 [Planctomycetes bacterium K23_9]